MEWEKWRNTGKSNKSDHTKLVVFPFLQRLVHNLGERGKIGGEFKREKVYLYTQGCMHVQLVGKCENILESDMASTLPTALLTHKKVLPSP